MAVVGIFTLHLTGTGCQQMLQSPKAVLDPVAPLPGPDEPRPADGRIETHHVELLLPGLTDYDDRHRTIRRTGRTQPRIAHPKHLRARPPGPIAGLLQVTPLDLAPVWQSEDIGTFPFYQESALVGAGQIAHEFRITKPAIGHDYGRGQCRTASAECRHAPIQHALQPVQFVAARRPRAWRVGPPDSKVDGDDQLALADHYDEQDAINTREHPV